MRETTERTLGAGWREIKAAFDWRLVLEFAGAFVAGALIMLAAFVWLAIT